MEEDRPSNRLNIQTLFFGIMVLVGFYAALRYGVEGAYALGKLVGASQLPLSTSFR